MKANSIQHLCLVGILALTSCAEITFEEPTAQPPLARIRITKRNGVVKEVFATLQTGERLTNVLDLSIFDGLTHRMTRGDLTQRLGEPITNRMHPEMGVPVDIYPVPKGEIGFMSVPTHGPRQPQVWAFPTNQSVVAVIRDESLRNQIASLLPGDKPVQVAVLRGDPGWGGITLTMSSNRVDSLILGARDGE